MSKRRITGTEFEVAQLMRNVAKEGLWELAPRLRLDAVVFGVAQGKDTVQVQATIAGNVEPYTHEEVAYYLGELGVNVLNDSLQA